MKKFTAVFICLLVLVSVLMPTAKAESGKYVTDNAGVMSSLTIAKLNKRAKLVSDNYGYDVVVCFTASLDGKSAMAYADDYYDYGGYGQGENRSGILLLVCPVSRDYWISTCGDGIKMFNDSRLDKIEEDVVNALRVNDWENAAYYFISDCEYWLNEGMPQPLSPMITLPICLALGFGVALIILSVEKSKLKSVKRQLSARSYIPQGGVRIDRSNERLINHLVTRTRINDSSSGGGGTHRSSSGSFHGGRGGKF